MKPNDNLSSQAKNQAFLKEKMRTPEGRLDACFGMGDKPEKGQRAGWKKDGEKSYSATFENAYAHFLSQKLEFILKTSKDPNAFSDFSFSMEVSPKGYDYTTFRITTDNVKNLTDCVSSLLKRVNYQNFPQFYVAKWQPRTFLST